MSSISSVSSATNPYLTSNQSGIGQFFQDFKALGSALQSGNLSTAQSALSTFQQDLQASAPAAAQTSSQSSSQPFGKNTQANTDFQNLTSALQSGDLSGAQQAFASLQNDLKTAKGHHHHHHHGSSGASSGTSATASSSTPASSSSTSASSVDGDSLNVSA
jgi:hypothetical protein